jgi:hypothetical protein
VAVLSPACLNLCLERLERLQLDEVKNPLWAGGLGLPCISSKSDSLFLTQTCRLLLDSSSLQYRHVTYWLGLHLREYFPDMARGPHAEFVSTYFQHMRLLLTEGLVLGDVCATKLRGVTAKALYDGFTSSFPPPKVIFKYNVDWQLVWDRLEYLVLEPFGREVVFNIVHNIVPNRERLYTKMHLVNTPNCMVCGVREDNTHIFTECVMVRESWGWVRMRLLGLLSEASAGCSNFELINLMFEKHHMDLESVWLVVTFVEYVWLEKFVRNMFVKLEQAIGHIKLRYKANQASRKPLLGHIPYIC